MDLWVNGWMNIFNKERYVLMQLMIRYKCSIKSNLDNSRKLIELYL